MGRIATVKNATACKCEADIGICNLEIVIGKALIQLSEFALLHQGNAATFSA